MYHLYLLFLHDKIRRHLSIFRFIMWYKAHPHSPSYDDAVFGSRVNVLDSLLWWYALAHIQTKFDTLSLWAIGPGQHFFIYGQGAEPKYIKKTLARTYKKTSPEHSFYKEFCIQIRSYLGNSIGAKQRYKPCRLTVWVSGVWGSGGWLGGGGVRRGGKFRAKSFS